MITAATEQIRLTLAERYLPLGRAIALRLAEQGADVAFMDRGDPAVAADTKAAIGALGRRLEKTLGENVDKNIGEFLGLGGQLDGLGCL